MKDGYIATLVHNRLDNPIVISSDVPTVLTVENPREFFRLVNELLKPIDGDSDFVLLNGDEEISIEKTCEVISDIFSLEIGDRKTLTALNKELINVANDGDLVMLQNEINTRIAEFYAELFDRVPLDLNFDEVAIGDLIKIGNVRLRDDYGELAEKIVCYINACVRLKHKTIFIFVNLKNSISDEDLKKLYKHCELEKVGLMLIEGRAQKPCFADEQNIVITDDLCQIG